MDLIRGFIVISNIAYFGEKMLHILEEMSKNITNITNAISLSAFLCFGLFLVSIVVFTLIKKRENPWIIAFIFFCLTITILVSVSLSHTIKENRYGSREIKARSSITFIRGYRFNDYIVWIDGAAFDESIVSVDYYFTDETALLKKRTSSEKQSGYSISYRGDRCYDLINIDVIYRDGNVKRIEYNMCNDTKP